MQSVWKMPTNRSCCTVAKDLAEHLDKRLSRPFLRGLMLDHASGRQAFVPYLINRNLIATVDSVEVGEQTFQARSTDTCQQLIG